LSNFIPKLGTNLIKLGRCDLSVEKFEKYLMQVANFQGKMNQLASSIEIILNDILEKIGIRPPRTFGGKIDVFGRNKSKLNKYTGNFDELLGKLKGFNENWNITKHGMAVGGPDIKDITVFKNGFFYVFDDKKREEIDQEFAQIQSALIAIHKKL